MWISYKFKLDEFQHWWDLQTELWLWNNWIISRVEGFNDCDQQNLLRLYYWTWFLKWKFIWGKQKWFIVLTKDIKTVEIVNIYIKLYDR